MPIYEYRCKACGHIISALIRKKEDEASLQCDRCAERNLVRIFSRFAVHKTEQQRLDEFDTRAPRGESFYKDDRNIGLWAQKRLGDLGVDLGDKFQETVEKARSGKLPDKGLTGPG
jgi:putative FmdB family regulatory protein